MIMLSLAQTLLPLAPLLLLIAFLLLGRYPGCEAAVRLGERIAARGRVAGATEAQARPVPLVSHAAHGGLLLALSLSGRAPPVRV